MLTKILFTVLAACGIQSNHSTPPDEPLAATGEGFSQGEIEYPDGGRSRWVTVTYELSTGQEAQAFVEVDTQGIGQGLIDLDGEPILQVTVDAHGITDLWAAPEADVSPEMFVELLGSAVAHDVFAGIVPEPAGFPCSDYGKTVWKASKWIWKGLILAGEAACCSTTDCILCSIGGEFIEGMGEAAWDDYCA